MTIMHTPVLLESAVKLWASLDEKKEVEPGIYVDATFGGGGHSNHLLGQSKKSGKITIIGIDRDKDQIEKAKEKYRKIIQEKKLFLFHDNFSNINEIISSFQEKQKHKIRVRGVLFDFGIATDHLAAGRGFSFQEKDSPLDMRFDSSEAITTASDILNESREEELLKIFREYGEERFSRKVAQSIVQNRRKKTIASVGDFLEILEKVLAPRYRKQRIHYATRVFQALRIAVNNEYENIEQGLAGALNVLDEGGRIVAISFHSGEDRIVKKFFQRERRDCICIENIPICICNHQKSLQIITRKPLTPGAEEIKINPNARSAKLRAATKI